MSERRDKLTIIYDMLKSIQAKGGKIKPTHLLYKSNLSHTKMKGYLSELLAKEMIEEINQKTGKNYAITNKGIDFLNNYRKIKEFIDSFGF